MPPEPESTNLHDELLLSLVAGIGPRLRRNLLGVFGSATAVLDAPRSQLAEVPGIGQKLADSVSNARGSIDLDGELELIAKHTAQLVFQGHAPYPRLLNEIVDPPPLLYVRGTLTEADNLAVAIVGTRHATAYGERQAERFARGLAAAGVTVVSGLARGIDTAAHRGALAAGGRTIAVLGGGLARCYPPENRPLASEILTSGAVLSEFAMRTAPTRGTFPQRNRVISGIALGVLVVEAPPKSGSLITATHATEQGREVFALPGPVDSAVSRGCHQLIRDGARLVESFEDILDEFSSYQFTRPATATTEPESARPAVVRSQPTPREPPEPREPLEELEPHEAAVLAAVPTSPQLMDEILAASGLPPHEVLGLITILELKGYVRRGEGNRWQRIR